MKKIVSGVKRLIFGLYQLLPIIAFYAIVVGLLMLEKYFPPQ